MCEYEKEEILKNKLCELDIRFFLLENILSVDDLMEKEIPQKWKKLDDLLFNCLQHKVVSSDFIQKYEPHIIRFGNLPFLTCVKVKGEWMVFNIWNCKREYLTLYKKLFTTQNEKSKVVGYSVKKAPIPKELYYCGLGETIKCCGRDWTADSGTLDNLFYYLEPGWMKEYKNIRCFKVMEDQSLIQVSLSKIECLNNNGKTRIENEQFSDTTHTLTNEEYCKYYGIIQ